MAHFTVELTALDLLVEVREEQGALDSLIEAREACE